MLKNISAQVYKNVYGWDEFKLVKEKAKRVFKKKKDDEKQKPTKDELDEFLDFLLFVLCLIYAYGWHDAENDLGTEIPLNDELQLAAVMAEIADETFLDRITADSTQDEIIRIIETESSRDYSAGVQDAAIESGLEDIKKRWCTLKDGKVRDSHRFLEGCEVGLTDWFYTWDGDSAQYPGNFDKPENNVNCRCYIELVR